MGMWLGLGLVALATGARGAGPSLNADVDAVRREMGKPPGTEADLRERGQLLFLWLGILQKRGADTHPFYDVDRRFYRLEGQLQGLAAGPERTGMEEELSRVIEEGFRVLEAVQDRWEKEGPMFQTKEGTARADGGKGDWNADWPMFQANAQNTGQTEAPGPSYGRAAWKFPVGFGWYARPVVENGRVYLASPGLRHT